MSDQYRPGPVDVSGFGVSCGLDVSKGTHHVVALASDGRRLHDGRLHDGPLPQDETRLRALFTDLAAHGQVLVLVNHPRPSVVLPVAVARDAGAQVAYLPGLAMRRIADLHPDTAGRNRRPRCLRHRQRRPDPAPHPAQGRRRRRHPGRPQR